MVRLEETIEVPRPLSEVFNYVSDFSHVSEWDPSMVESSRLTEGPLREGSTFLLVARFMGRRVPMRYRLVTLEAPRRVRLEGAARTVKSIDEVRFRESGGGTRIHYIADISLRRPFRPFERLLTPFLRRMGRAAIKGLEATLREPTGHPLHA